LTRVEYYQIGNNSRSWVGVNELAFITADPVVIPEPSTIALIGLGGLGLALFARRRR
jgi:hypothetical protein